MTQPTALNYVTCEFGRPGDWAAGYHTGIDYRAPVGTRVHATRRGRVIHVGVDDAYGKYVIVESWHFRWVRHYYCHLSEFSVKEGQRIYAGNVIGLSGDTGNTSGPHLHYEERHYPFGYYDHHKPILPGWKPQGKKANQKILKRLGISKKKMIY